ncbi:hypothetical protein J8M20_16190 [Pseudoalteromonas luteoviolacea]|uniref:hypothetical protein n=1 Tax=Pseudoalteromonas luteoviolacea TaxID=43657 RepID=UPI001B38CF93|nr:hypothetical protein [Pseudoalteromonas luteoviolacea]MBQ4812901.1 hypothetical protein [Pseudoalteromonas luteoviolacea]
METEQKKHVLIGAMIKGQDNPAFNKDVGKWKDVPTDKVFNKSLHRGGINYVPPAGHFKWDVDGLNHNVSRIRGMAGFSEDDPNFHIIANVNTYQTPGFGDIPASSEQKHMTTFGSGWALPYKLNPYSDAENYEEDHLKVLTHWQKYPLDPEEKMNSNNSMGPDNAKHVLRYLTKKYWSENKNFVIPHRGLRNETIKHIGSLKIIDKAADGEYDYLSIIHLDDDMQIKDPSIVKKILEENEVRADSEVSKTKKEPHGIAFSTPGYIYNMESNLLEYTASILSHIGGRITEDAYPSEPGLTFTYRKDAEENVWREFLTQNPWGVENDNLQELPSYGKKQQAARVESKEGRAFAAMFSSYMITQRKGLKNAAKYKVPIRNSGFFSVDMSSLAKTEILGKNDDIDLKSLDLNAVQDLIHTYIKRNKYHPLNSSSRSAQSFIKYVLPKVAEFVKSVIEDTEVPESNKADKILHALEEKSDAWYKSQMSPKKEAQPTDYIEAVKHYWEENVLNTVQYVNETFSGHMNFEEVDYDDVVDALTDSQNASRTDNPFELDYVTGETEYIQYIGEINTAIRAYIDKVKSDYV